MEQVSTPLIFLFPGLTAMTGLISLLVTIISWNTPCEDYNNTIAHVWLLVYVICCIPGIFFGAVGAFERKNGLKGGIRLLLFSIFLIGTFIWCVAGYIMLFGYFNCLSNPMAGVMLVDIIYQTLGFVIGTTLWFCC